MSATPPFSGGENHNGSRLRVAIMLDSVVQPAWVARVIDDILESNVAALALVIRNVSSSPPEPNSVFHRLRRLYRNRDLLLFAGYSRFDSRRNRIRTSAFADVDVTGKL